MKAKHSQRAAPPLAGQTGVIGRGAHQPDEYVELTYLSRYLAKLRDVSAR